MRELPPETLDTIFAYLRDHHGYSSLCPCLAVCRHWHDLARRVLWRHVALDGQRLSRFLQTCFVITTDLSSRVNPATAPPSPHLVPVPLPPIHSLTIRIIPGITEVVPRYLRAEVTAEQAERAAELNRNLRQLALLIRTSMPALLSFSLTLSQSNEVAPVVDDDDDDEATTTGYFLDAGAVTDVLHALPPTCVALELETNNWEQQRVGYDDDDVETAATTTQRVKTKKKAHHHLCPEIRGILPRLEHLSICLASVCRDMLYDDDHHHRNNQTKTTTTPTPTPTPTTELLFPLLPNLRTLLVSLSPRQGQVSGVNPECDSMAARDHSIQGYVPALAAALRDARARGCFPRAAQVEVAHYQLNLDEENCRYFSIPRERLLPLRNDNDSDGAGAGAGISSTKAKTKVHPLYMSLLVVRDCLRDVTYPLPVREMEAAYSYSPSLSPASATADEYGANHRNNYHRIRQPRPKKGKKGATVLYDRDDRCCIDDGSGDATGQDLWWSGLVEEAGARTPWGEARETWTREAGTGVRAPRGLFRDVLLEERPVFMTREDLEAAAAGATVTLAPGGAAAADWDPDPEQPWSSSTKWRRVVPLEGADAKVEKHMLPQTRGL